MGIDHPLGHPGYAAPDHVDDCPAMRALVQPFLQGRPGIGGFPGLAYHHQKDFIIENRVPGSEFRCQVHLDRDPAKVFDHVLGHKRRMIGSTAGYEADPVDFFKQRFIHI